MEEEKLIVHKKLIKNIKNFKYEHEHETKILFSLAVIPERVEKNKKYNEQEKQRNAKLEKCLWWIFVVGIFYWLFFYSLKRREHFL